jgi:hypothetical protein
LDDNCDGHIDEGFPDADADGLANCIDPCTDTDHDGFGNPGFSSNTCTLDNCPTVSNPTQADADADGVGNACDTCTDTDGDGFGNPGYSANTCDLDNCPTVSNPTQADADDDGIGDACDTCTDPDFDGYGNPGFGCSGCAAHPNHPDNCPTIYNPNQADADSDHIGDVCDTCTDTDQDGYGNPGYSANTCAVDNCPTVANASQANADGDSLGDACDTCTDTDGDGFGNPGYSANTCAVDNCPTVSNSTQADGDNDGVGNACDNCPSDYNPTQAYVGNPIVQVLYPNGGETLHVGSTATLTWTASDTCGGVSSVDILISRDGVTGSYTTLFTGLANTGSKTWTVTAPTTAPNKVFIKVIAHDPAGNSGQDTGNSGARITN